MNKLLASALGYLNGLLAIVLVVGGGLAGEALRQTIGEPSAIIWGLSLGMFLAIVVCGLVAVFISMRNELVAIRNLLVKQSQ